MKNLTVLGILEKRPCNTSLSPKKSLSTEKQAYEASAKAIWAQKLYLATPGRDEAGDSLDSDGKISLAKLPDVTLLNL